MKIDTIKCFIAFVISLLLGFICEVIAPELGGRNWISLATGFISIAACIVPAMAIKYHNPRRGVSIKTLAWVLVILVTMTNIIFSSFEYKVDVYIVVVLLLVAIGWGLIYGLYSAKENDSVGQ